MGRIAVDIGGTFTDAVWVDDGRLHAVKVPSIRDEQDKSVDTAVKSLGVSLGSVDDFIHGTTAALNALLERRGARLAMLVTAGFRDVYEIGRANRPEMYNIHWRRPAMLLRRRDILEIAGRCAADGTVLQELDEPALRGQIRTLRGAYDAVAVCLLHAYIDPTHERRVAEIVREEAPDVIAVCSHEVAPEWREYERWSSTLVSAYVTPAVTRYLRRLSDRLATDGLATELYVMQSNGGITSAPAASRHAANMLFSGPVGGAIAGVTISRQTASDHLICVDMGGTSFDVSLVIDGAAEMENQIEVAGHPLLTPSVYVTSLGAGGGSIAYIESGGLRVGTKSAGADPGPACYGRGGTLPTVTDANFLLGRIPQGALLGGTVELDYQACATALGSLAAELDFDPVEVAEGIISVANAMMADAIREVTIARGIDPRDFDLLAFGGAGPLHAVAIAEELELKRVIVPAGAGTLSAWGMLQAPVRQDFVKSFFRSLDAVDLGELERAIAQLLIEGETALGDQGIASDRIRCEPTVDLRYHGQEYTLTIPVPKPLHAESVDDIARRFTETHEARYSHSNPGAPVEIVSVRLVALGVSDSSLGWPLESRPAPAPDAVVQTFFARTAHPTALYSRSSLGSEVSLSGPCIILEEGCTTLVPPRWRAGTSPDGHLLLERHET